MPQMQPAEALATCEQALRSLIATVLAKKLGKDWFSQVFSEKRAVKIRDVRDEEAGRRTRRGVASVPSSELAYAQFFDILDLLKKYWADFKPALGNQNETLGLLNRFEALRNSVAHSRDLLPFEEELLSGIAGEIRNRVTIYMSSQDPTGDYFARIDSVTDSLGNCIDSFLPDPMEHGVSLRTGAVLHPGETITFRCRGTDPQGRDLTWWVLPTREEDNPSYTGRDLDIVWRVSSDDISARRDVHIYMKSSGPYHRVDTEAAGFDYCATFIYTVVPRKNSTRATS
ncbi:Swt1 family HEPN domain-containing protein [Streptomyces sp. NPDC058685]|uniref:Swt1 family HEPN domain-containing protein n=1 Tax=Streptomyces sp. NPDC058685 TaxID=3346598 RepID=UPI003646D1B0